MPQVEKLLVFLASPGDVPTERRYVEEIVAELNRTVASDKGEVLQIVRWENDAFPGYGQDAQALINTQIAEMSKYALFVGIMWNRLGTPTPRAASGTVEEFERAVVAFKQNQQPDIWFYFRESASKLDTEDQLEQRKKVLAFKKEVQANGMPWTYKNPTDFRDKLRNQMMLWLNARSRILKSGTGLGDKIKDDSQAVEAEEHYNVEDALRELIEPMRRSRTFFRAQVKRRDQLVERMRRRLRIKGDIQYEGFFVQFFKKMNNHEKFLFEQIRAMTEELKNGNAEALAVLTRHPQLQDQHPRLRDYKSHLQFWLNKYDIVFRKRPDMCVLYTGEFEDGVGYPLGLHAEMEEALANASQGKGSA
jgi:hypothetical protein